jgi:hypothetical protein
MAETKVTYKLGAYTVDALRSVTVTINDPSVIARVVENHDDEGVPQPFEKDGTGWRNVFYDITDADGVVEMLAYNCAVNGVTKANSLDGWADLGDDAATMEERSGDEWVEVIAVLPPEKS